MSAFFSDISDFILSQPFYLQALAATLFTWAVTALGAGLVIFSRSINANVMDAMLGFAAGVMMAASFFSLLSPALILADSLGLASWIHVAAGFVTGGLLLFAGDGVFNALDKRMGSGGSLKRCLALVTSITLHNIPEGIAVGVAFGSLAYGLDGATPASAYMLALGIGLQNFPEGGAVSLPLRREGYSRRKSFFFGQLSGVVEPISGVLGALLAVKMRFALPFMLSFAAGAMIYVTVAELVPESASNKHKEIMALFTLVGFAVMMVMDVTLG